MGRHPPPVLAQLLEMARRKPQLLSLYLSLSAAGEYRFDHRQVARERISAQLGHDPLASQPVSQAPGQTPERRDESRAGLLLGRP